MTALIIDDEAHCISSLQKDLKMFCPEVAVLDTCNTAKEGLLAIRRHAPDVVFLDIEMPWMNGFELLDAIGDIDFQIIFTTAYDQFAARAFRVSAADYLLKPIDSNDLIAAVSKVAQRLLLVNSAAGVPQEARQSTGLQKVAIPTREGYELIAAAQILYCKAEGAYTYMLLEDGRRILLSKSLGETEQLLPEESFVRVHHSYIANVDHVTLFRKTDGVALIMSNGDELAVSKSRRDILLQKLGIRKNL